MPTSATNELGKHPSKMVTTELLEKTNNEKDKLDMVLWNTSQNYEVITCHTRKKIGLIRTRRRETHLTGRIKEELGSFKSTINSNNP